MLIENQARILKIVGPYFGGKKWQCSLARVVGVSGASISNYVNRDSMAKPEFWDSIITMLKERQLDISQAIREVQVHRDNVTAYLAERVKKDDESAKELPPSMKPSALREYQIKYRARRKSEALRKKLVQQTHLQGRILTDKEYRNFSYDACFGNEMAESFIARAAHIKVYDWLGFTHILHPSAGATNDQAFESFCNAFAKEHRLLRRQIIGTKMNDSSYLIAFKDRAAEDVEFINPEANATDFEINETAIAFDGKKRLRVKIKRYHPTKSFMLFAATRDGEGEELEFDARRLMKVRQKIFTPKEDAQAAAH